MSKKVAVIMGSDSDLPTMQVAGAILEQFGVRHTTPPTLPPCPSQIA